MNNEQISPYCGTIIKRGANNTSLINITFPISNYIYIYALLFEETEMYIQYYTDLFLDLNQDLFSVQLKDKIFDNDSHPTETFISVSSHSNTSLQVTISADIYNDRTGSYRDYTACDVYYVCFS